MPPEVARVLIVMPTYNEHDNVPIIVPKVLGQAPGIDVLVSAIRWNVIPDVQSPNATPRIDSTASGSKSPTKDRLAPAPAP